MSEPESWQVSTDAAEVYESCFVPAIFGAWARPVADAAGIGPGDRILDVACGTGVLAREAYRRAGEDGHVTGLDLNEGMLAVASRVEPGITWRQGDAGQLPFDAQSFDVVVSQCALMYFPDRVAALREMLRVLRSGGRLAVASWASIDHAPGYKILVEIANRRCGSAAGDILAAPMVLGDPDELAELYRAAGIAGAEIMLHDGQIRFPSVQEFIRTEVKGSPLAELIDDAAMDALATESEAALAEFITPSGEIVMPMDAYIVTAVKQA